MLISPPYLGRSGLITLLLTFCSYGTHATESGANLGLWNRLCSALFTAGYSTESDTSPAPPVSDGELNYVLPLDERVRVVVRSEPQVPPPPSQFHPTDPYSANDLKDSLFLRLLGLPHRPRYISFQLGRLKLLWARRKLSSKSQQDQLRAIQTISEVAIPVTSITGTRRTKAFNLLLKDTLEALRSFVEEPGPHSLRESALLALFLLARTHSSTSEIPPYHAGFVGKFAYDLIGDMARSGLPTDRLTKLAEFEWKNIRAPESNWRRRNPDSEYYPAWFDIEFGSPE